MGDLSHGNKSFLIGKQKSMEVHGLGCSTLLDLPKLCLKKQYHASLIYKVNFFGKHFTLYSSSFYK